MPNRPTPTFGVTTGRPNPSAVADKLNRALSSKVSRVIGDGLIEASNIGDDVHLRLKVENLLPLIPKVSGILLVHLDHLGDGVYNAHAWTDPDLTGDPIGTSVQPAYRPFGTAIDFTQYGETGIGYTDDDDEFVLILAIEERYAMNPCPDPP